MDTTIKIIPAIMPTDYEDLVSKAGLVKNKAEWVQIDVMDSKYTNSISWPYSNNEHFLEILNGDEGLPFWENINYELDLMVNNPKTESLKWVTAGAARIILHLKTLEDDFEELINELKNLGVEVGIAILPNEDYSKIEKILDKIDFIQFMGIQNVGFQNQEFAEEILEQIKNFHDKYPEKIISVDGGVGVDTAKKLAEAGVKRLVSGSFVFSGNVEENIKELRNSF
jgi:ribulose-phosphate 3-epimerase